MDRMLKTFTKFVFVYEEARDAVSIWSILNNRVRKYTQGKIRVIRLLVVFAFPSLYATIMDKSSKTKLWETAKTIVALIVLLALLAFSCWLNIYWCFGWC